MSKDGRWVIDVYVNQHGDNVQILHTDKEHWSQQVNPSVSVSDRFSTDNESFSPRFGADLTKRYLLDK